MIRAFSPWETLPLSGEYVIINPETEELILADTKQTVQFSLKEINATLLKNFPHNDTPNMKPENLTFTLSKDKKTIKILFQSYALKNPKFTGSEDTKEYANIS